MGMSVSFHTYNPEVRVAKGDSNKHRGWAAIEDGDNTIHIFGSLEDLIHIGQEIVIQAQNLKEAEDVLVLKGKPLTSELNELHYQAEKEVEAVNWDKAWEAYEGGKVIESKVSRYRYRNNMTEPFKAKEIRGTWEIL